MNIVVIGENMETLFNVTVNDNCLIGVIEENTSDPDWNDLKLIYSNKKEVDLFDFKWLSAKCKSVNLLKRTFIKDVIQCVLFILIVIVLIVIFLL